jgi:hypothetical protein
MGAAAVIVCLLTLLGVPGMNWFWLPTLTNRSGIRSHIGLHPQTVSGQCECERVPLGFVKGRITRT